MPWYAVQEGDWDWDSNAFSAFIVNAEKPEAAAQQALKSWQARGETGDGMYLKIARLSLDGLIDWTSEGDFGAFQKFKPEPKNDRDEFLWMLTTGEGLPHGDMDAIIADHGFGVVSLEVLKEIDSVLIGAIGHIPDEAARNRAIDAIDALREQAATARHG